MNERFLHEENIFTPEEQVRLNQAADAALAVISSIVGTGLQEVVMAGLLTIIKAYLSAHAEHRHVDETADWLKTIFKENLEKHFAGRSEDGRPN